MFVIGNTYNRVRDIHEKIGGQRQGGISTPANSPYVILFTGESGEAYGYADGWDQNNSGVFRYTGEGQLGPMTFTGGNKAIREHAAEGKDLLLFQALGKGKPYRYLGRFACQDWEAVQAPDRENHPREAIVFLLAKLDEERADKDLVGESLPVEREPPVASVSELRRQAYLAAAPRASGRSVHAEKTVYQRADAVRRYVLARAKGICEGCRKPAPFERKAGGPYLEPHHTRRVSDGGPDHPRWVAALCSNCHSQIHFGSGGEELNRRVESFLGEVEPADAPAPDVQV
jgi:5-methylcytosine-specific restriction enzyme A